MDADQALAQDYVQNISESGLTIYDEIEIGDPDFWIPSPTLEILLNRGLKGISVKGLALRTRSKKVKSEVCRILGYPAPDSFKRTQPRFPGQKFDVYVQKQRNLQVWNQEIDLTRRYVIVRVNEDDRIDKVKVVTGDVLVEWDTTGALTQKYQARLVPKDERAELISQEDTGTIKSFIAESLFPTDFDVNPTSYPEAHTLLPIQVVFERLSKLIGQKFPDAGYDQERNRGWALHRLACDALGYKDPRDDGRFPDIRHQLIETKLQTSPTIDLGLVKPDSEAPLDVPKLQGKQIRHCDVRYAIFYANTDGKEIELTHLFLTTGEDFFTRFPQFQGKVLNKKLQIPIQSDLFED